MHLVPKYGVECDDAKLCVMCYKCKIFISLDVLQSQHYNFYHHQKLWFHKTDHKSTAGVMYVCLLRYIC